jgi:hypothetical protein
LRGVLLAGRAGVHVDFHANRHFDDLRCLPGHLISPGLRGERPVQRQNYVHGSNSASAGYRINYYDLCTFMMAAPAIPIRNCGEIVGSVLQASAAVRRTQPSSWSGYNALIDNVPDPRIDIGIPRQRVLAR